ncbi:CCAAT/enhancer-binding protein isoform X1 [Folsomia candida]|uniref:CCAAT/enhancer-binding protein isoform X1 n=1 Tax=Folsomia candida TaxID=158441 RepID=UPI000B8FD84A|nr:CCAAT/enhancer-binding protein isoform X1 [Folsomia candida]
MYDTGIENLKKAALSVKVRSFLSNQGEIDPSDLDNPELSLDLQSLIDDPNFEVSEGLFPELLQDKVSGSAAHTQLSLRNHLVHTQSHHHHPHQQQQHNNNHHNNGQQQQHFRHSGGNPLAYLPQPVHGGSFAPNSASSSPSSSPHMNHGGGGGGGGESGEGVKSEPMDNHRLDFNANTVSSSSDPGYSSYSSSNNLTSPSSTSSTSSSGGGGGGGGSSYSPTYGGGNIHQMGGVHHHQGAEQGLTVGKNGVLTFNGGHPSQKLLGHSHGHSNHHHHLSKKLKNVDKASDEYKRRRERNNIAVRKSREKAKLRSRETEERVKILCKENERLQKKIDLLTEELTFLRSFFSNVGALPEQLGREFNKHLEAFQHHHIQNGIQFPSFASFKSMQ